MRRALGVALCAALAWTSMASPARADGSRVVIVRDRGADPVLDRARVRLAGELRAAGFVVEERVVDGDDDARRLVEDHGDAGEASGVFATVLLRRAGGRAATDVWVSDHVTHKTVVRRMRPRSGGDGADRALALRVVELMRASLVEGLVLPPSDEDVAAAPTAAPPGPAPAAASAAAPAPVRLPPPDVAAWTREAMHEPSPAPRRVALALGVAGAFAGPDVGLAVAPTVRVAWRAATAWSIAALALGPAFGARVAATEGNATVRQELALAEVAFEPPTSGALSGLVAIGAGAYHLDLTGNATAPFASGHDEAWAVLLSAGAGLRVRLSGLASLVLDAREVLAVPRPVVVFASERVAAAMRPGTLGSFTLAVDL
jgi:hypothetical protein